MFCVECGTEGPVYEGLCAKCFRKKYPVVQPIELLDIARCESCGSYRLRSGWSKVDRELAKGLAREIAGSFGGTVSASPKLFGQKQGKEVYRVTALVRLAAFQKGDVVRHKGSLAEVTSIRPFVVLRDLVTGERRRFKPKDVRGARRIDAGRVEART